MANTFLTLINTPIGTFVTQVTLLTGALFGLQQLIGAMDIFKVIGAQIANLPALFGALTGAIKGTTTATALFGTALNTAFPIIAAISAALVIVPKIFDAVTTSIEDVEEQIDDLTSKLEELRAEEENLQNKISSGQGTELDEKRLAILEKQIQLQEKALALKEQEAFEYEYGGDVEEGYKALDYMQQAASSVDLFRSELEKLGPITEENTEQAIELKENIDYWTDALVEQATIYSEEYEALLAQKEAGRELSDTQQDFLDQYPEIMEWLEQYIDFTEAASDSVSDLGNDIKSETQEVVSLANQLSELQEVYDTLSSAVEEYNTNGGFTLDTLNKLLELDYDYLNSLELQNGQLVLNSTQLYNRAVGLKEQAKQELTAKTITELNSIATQDLSGSIESAGTSADDAYDFFSNFSSVLYQVASGSLSAGAAVNYLWSSMNPEEMGGRTFSEEAKAAMNETLATYRALMAEIDASEIGFGGGEAMASAEKTTDIIAEQTGLFKEQIEILEHELLLLEKVGASDEERVAKLQEIQAALHDQANWYRNQGLDDNSEYIRGLQQQWWGFNDDIQDIYDEQAEAAKEAWEDALNAQIDVLNEQKDAYETAFNYIVKQIEKEIDALKNQRDAEEKFWDDKIQALKDQNDAIDEQIALQEKQQALAEANQRKLFVFKDGRFQYISDLDEVAQATAELEAYEREQALQQEVDNLETLKEQALAAIDEQIAGWEEYKEQWSSVVDNYQEEQDRLIAEQVLGIELEGQNWRTRLDNLAQYVAEYNSLMAQLSGVQAELDAGYQGTTAGGTGGGGGVSTSYSQSNPEQFFTSAGFDSYATIPGALGGNVGINIENGRTTTTGLPVGTIVHTQGGDYQITGGTGEAGNPYQSVKVEGYASGTLSASGGLSLVGENGPELRVMGSGDGVLPSDITSNLWDWGKLSPGDLISNLGNNIMNIVIENLNLPGVTDGESFVAYLQSNAWSQAVQFASNR